MSIIAIDGDSAVGKSAAARIVAIDLKGSVIDTGQILRATTARALELDRSLCTPQALRQLIKSIYVADYDPSNLYTLDIEIAVPVLSAKEAIQDELTQLIRGTPTQNRLHIIVGRTIGTTVVPYADLKVYLTASLEVRAARKAAQLRVTPVQAAELLTRRDAADANRDVNPARRNPEAVQIDTSKLSPSKVAHRIVYAFRKTIPMR